MKTQTVILGIVLLVAGLVVFVIFQFNPGNIAGRTHQIIPAGGIGLAILGGILTLLGATSKLSTQPGQFKCQTCGAVFGSDTALKSHAKDKHGS